jgi:TatD DNase family protein
MDYTNISGIQKMLFDSHVHFDGLGELPAVHDSIHRAMKAGVKKMLAVGGGNKANTFAVEIASHYPENIFPSAGFDREEAVQLEEVSSDRLKQCILEIIENSQRKAVRVVAIGETGLDFYYSPDTARAQMRLFEVQLEIAKDLNLPVIIHCRDAEKEVLQILRKHASSGKSDKLRGVLHCCTGTVDFVREVIEIGYHIGLSGIITFKNADNLRQLALEIPEDKILIETDSPYLAPEPRRGRPNEPSFLVHVAQKLAELRGESLERIAEITSCNAEKLFLKNSTNIDLQNSF